MPIRAPSNDDIAHLLEQIADLLEQQDDNPYRIQAFRHGAKSVRASATPLTEMAHAEGASALLRLEGIGQGLATTIFEFIETGRSDYLQGLQARQSPADLLQQIPGIGEKLAQRIVRHLGVSSLQAFEQAVQAGRLEQVFGLGPRRVAAVRNSLAGLLGDSAGATGAAGTEPGVALLLDVDGEYRRRAEAGELPKLAPRRFNPNNEAWLPLLRTERDGWVMTALFSNTARAHELGKTHDWVVIYYQKDGPEGQCTVVTETSGPLAGKRVIRGREGECEQFYLSRAEKGKS
ncbi:MAG: DNA-binding protein [Anaerolineae bacterium]|nr:DNA-binding protein [Anaerolineae bacterium]